MTAVIGALVFHFSRLDRAAIEYQSSLLSNFAIFSVIIVFMTLAARKTGAAVRDLCRRRQGRLPGGHRPSFRTWWPCWWPSAFCGPAARWTCFSNAVRWGVEWFGIDTRWVDGLPTALMRPLSGSGARGMMLETMETIGADSFAGRLVSTIQGSTETTFYVLAVYFGSVGIKNTRHAVGCGLAADLAGAIGAILVTYLFFG